MTLQLEAASPRLSVSVVGRHRADARVGRERDVQRARHLTRPVRALFLPRTVARSRPPSSAASVAGRRRAEGHRPPARRCDGRSARHATVRLRAAQRAADSAGPRSPLGARHRHARRRQDTQIDIAGVANLHDETINMRANGDANLAVFQGFVSDLRSSGTAHPVGHARRVAQATRWSAGRWR